MKSTFNNNNLQTILLILLVGFIVYNFFHTQTIHNDVNSYKDKIESLSNQIDTVKLINDKIDVKLVSVDKYISEIDENIINVGKNIKNFKQKTNAKINSVDNYTYNELELFFTNRYN